MKILDLKFKAFGPFLKEQHIDFSELNDKGMFLINGPTGVGKTSLFDAVVFALYGKGSGKDRDDGKSLRSDFAKDEDLTYVDLTFEANGQIYRVYRQPAYTRKAKKGNGTTSESAKAELYMPDGSVISKPKDVDEKIINEIIFIDRNQFKSVALLAQGEFTELITASSKDRAAILEHIFQKEKYDFFQDKLTELFKRAEGQKNTSVTTLNTLLSKVDGGDEIIGYNEALNDPSNIPTFVNNLDALIKALKEEFPSKNNATETAHQEYSDANAKLTNLQKDNEQITSYLDASKKLDELNNKKGLMDGLKKAYESSVEFENLKPLFKQLKQQEDIIKVNETSIKTANEKLKEVAEARTWLTDNEGIYNSNKDNIVNLSSTVNTLKNISKEKSSLVKEKASVEQLDKDYSKECVLFDQKDKEFSETKRKFFASSAYNLAQLLEDDKPCPVCGSIHHPHKAQNSDPVSEEDYKKAENDFNSVKNSLEESKRNLDSKRAAFEASENAFVKNLNNSGFPDADKEFIYSNQLEDAIKNSKKQLDDIVKFNSDYETKLNDTNAAESSTKQTIQDANNNINTSKGIIENTNGDIEKKLKENVYITTREKYFERISSESKEHKFKLNLDAIKKELEGYQKDLIANQTIVDNTPKELIAKGNVDEAQLVQEVSDKKNAYEELNNEKSAFENRIRNLEKDSKSIKNEYKKCESIIKEYSSLSELSKTANGANKMKLSFKMYILADYFDKIIVQANRRLSRITNGRYKLVRRDSLGKGNAQQGLDLDVYDIETGKERPASSLSGGEKFVSALSMALGLSDIIETNHALIRVESIFIDEGFGTLDENYLDMAMKALETLKDDNKSVAIISHVEKLKEYIPDGLEIQKDTIGSKVVIKNNI